jgi:hypothetical protein
MSLFGRSLSRFNAKSCPPPSRFFSAARRLQIDPKPAEPPKPFATNARPRDAFDDGEPKERPAWLIHKEKIKEKLDGEAWNPRKKLSPDTMEGIRHLHQTQPEKFTTSLLAQHFKVSPEAIRRILKSKWRPNDAEAEDRLRRWDKRGEKIWSNLVELGIKPPKKWREMGVGRSSNGEVPRWKSRGVPRNMVPVNDSVTIDENAEELIPIVDGRAYAERPSREIRPLSHRLGV